MFGSRHSCLVSVSCRGSDTRAPRSVSLCECEVSSSLGRTLFCPRVFCVLCYSTQFVFLSAACFILCCVARSLCISLTYFLCEHVAYEFSFD